jgi:hypothetical protein
MRDLTSSVLELAIIVFVLITLAVSTAALSQLSGN